MNILKATRLRGLYRDMVAKVRTLEGTALKLMRHPDATPEQIWAVHKTLVDLHIWLHDVRQQAWDKHKVDLT